jgi:hypothetical protein
MKKGEEAAAIMVVVEMTATKVKITESKISS